MAHLVKVIKEPATQSDPWVACGNPVRYSVQRQDYEIVSVANNGSGLAKIRVVDATVVNGTQIRVYALPSYNGVVCTVTAVVIVGAGPYYDWTTDMPYVGNDPGFANLISFNGYYVKTVVQGRTMKTVPDPITGISIVDISDAVRTKIGNYKDPVLPAASNAIDQDHAINPAPTFTGVYPDGTETTPAVETLYTRTVLAARQLTDEYRNNMKPFYSGDDNQATAIAADWTNHGGAIDWVYDAMSSTWNLVGLDGGQSSAELEFVTGAYRRPGRWWFYIAPEVDTLGYSPQIGRILFYDNGVLVFTYEVEFIGTAGMPYSVVTGVEILVPVQFNACRFQLFNPSPNGITDQTVNFQLAGGLTLFRQFRMLSLMDRLVAWRGWPFTMSWMYPGRSGAFNVTIKFEQINSSGAVFEDGDTPNAISVMPAGAFNRMRVLWQFKDVDTPYFNVDSVTLKLSAYWLSQQGSDSWYIDIKEPCKKPYYLYWKNSVSGDTWWLFEINQEYQYTYEDGRKVKRVLLFADSVTPDQWESINDLNRPTPTYDVPGTDFATDRRTSAQDGSTVFKVDKDGVMIGVVVVPTEQRYLARSARRSISILVEEPVIYTT